VAVEEA
jgi:hypothetical protein